MGLLLQHFEKSFGGVRALVDGCMDAPSGEVHGILGENGAGKSTLIRILSGVVQSDSGEALLDSRPLVIRSPREALREGIATVFQESSLIPALTVEENLLFGRLPIGWHRRIRARELRSQYDLVMDSLKTRHLSPKTLVRHLSLEDRQMLEVMKAVSGLPDVLILDEATAALTPEDTAWVLSQARATAERGAVVLFVSHRMQEIRSVADRVTVLRGGRTALEAKVDEVEDDDLITAMLGHRLEELYPQRANHSLGEVVLDAENLKVGRSCGPMSFQLHRGEILGVFALPGQGQGELLMSIAGANRHGGRLALEGQAYAPRSPADAQRRGVLLVPGDRAREALFLDHSSQMNITISRLKRGRGLRFLLDLRAEHRDAAAAADRIGLAANRLPDLISTLSGGNQQKAIFARVLLGKPKILVLYDSTRGVDVGTKADIYRLIMSLADQGVSVIFYSTDITETIQVCDRILVLEQGQIVGDLLSKDADEQTLLSLAVGKVSVSPAAEPEAAPEVRA